MQNQNNAPSGQRTPDQSQDRSDNNRQQLPQLVHAWPFTRQRRNAVSGSLVPLTPQFQNQHEVQQREPSRSMATTPAMVQTGALPSEPSTVPNVDRSLDQFANQQTTHLTTGPSHAWYNHRQPRVVVIGRNHYQYGWEYPYRPGRPTYPMTVAEKAAYLQRHGNSNLHAGQANANGAAGGLSRGAEGGQGGVVSNDTGEERDDSWMEEYVDFDGNVNP